MRRKAFPKKWQFELAGDGSTRIARTGHAGEGSSTIKGVVHARANSFRLE
jgi:hypothetical protein